MQNSPAATSGCSWPSKPNASPPTPPAHRVANARPLSAIIGQPTPTTDSDIYIAHALINPAGIDPGHEIVVLANLATAPATLSGWTPIDRNDRAITVEASIPAGGTTLIALDGAGVQLGCAGRRGLTG